MKIEYANNPRVTVRQEIPCAIVADGDHLYIDRNHPHAAELSEIAAEMMNHVQWLDDDDEKGYKLLDRVQTLAGARASFELSDAWRDFLRRKQYAEMERDATEWVTQWSGLDVDDRSNSDPDFLSILYNTGKWAFPEVAYDAGLSAVFAYGYECGQRDAKGIAT